MLSTGLSGPVVATESMLCCTGPPLPETLKLLAPLANLEVLSLGGNMLGGAITADVIVFANLKELVLSNMGLGGKPLSIRADRIIPFINVCIGTHRRRFK